MNELNLENISYLVGIAISLLSEQVPVLKFWLDGMTAKERFFFQLVAVLVVVLGINGLSCLNAGINYDCLDWQLLSNALMSWSFGQVIHWIRK